MAKKDKETAEDVRAAYAERDALFRLNLDTVATKVVNKMNGIDEDGGSGLVDPMAARKQRQIEAGIVNGPEDHHVDWGAFLQKTNPGMASKVAGRSMGRPAAAPNTISLALANRQAEAFSPVVSELNKFKFASVDDKREEQMREIVSGVREVIKKLAVKEVAANTRRFYDNVAKFFQTTSGVKAIYKVASSHVTVVAEGQFCGDEIVCLEQDGTNVTAYVARQFDDQFEDISGNFNIKLELSK
jgi:hypothetical protein